MTDVVEDEADSAAVPAGASAATKKKRGRETAGDMIRSLSVVLVLVVGMWFLAQPPDSDEQEVRVVDTTGDVAAFSAEVPGVPVPDGLPDGWRPTSSTLSTGTLRIGYVTPDGKYAEYAASTAPGEDFVDDLVGPGAQELPDVQVDGVTYAQRRDAGALSLVRTEGASSVVLGTLRSTATRDELEELAGALEP